MGQKYGILHCKKQEIGPSLISPSKHPTMNVNRSSSEAVPDVEVLDPSWKVAPAFPAKFSDYGSFKICLLSNSSYSNFFIDDSIRCQKHVEAFVSEKPKVKTWENIDFYTLLILLVTHRTSVTIRIQKHFLDPKRKKWKCLSLQYINCSLLIKEINQSLENSEQILMDKNKILIRKWWNQRLGGLQYNGVSAQHKSSIHCKISDFAANKYDICMRANLSATIKLFISLFLCW